MKGLIERIVAALAADWTLDAAPLARDGYLTLARPDVLTRDDLATTCAALAQTGVAPSRLATAQFGAAFATQPAPRDPAALWAALWAQGVGFRIVEFGAAAAIVCPDESYGHFIALRADLAAGPFTGEVEAADRAFAAWIEAPHHSPTGRAFLAALFDAMRAARARLPT